MGSILLPFHRRGRVPEEYPDGPSLEVFGFEFAGERGLRRPRDAPKILDVGAAGYLPLGLDVLAVGPLRVSCGVEPY
jgi:hypothetical protein